MTQKIIFIDKELKTKIEEIRKKLFISEHDIIILILRDFFKDKDNIKEDIFYER